MNEIVELIGLQQGLIKTTQKLHRQFISRDNVAKTKTYLNCIGITLRDIYLQFKVWNSKIQWIVRETSQIVEDIPYFSEEWFLNFSDQYFTFYGKVLDSLRECSNLKSSIDPIPNTFRNKFLRTSKFSAQKGNTNFHGVFSDGLLPINKFEETNSEINLQNKSENSFKISEATSDHCLCLSSQTNLSLLTSFALNSKNSKNARKIKVSIKLSENFNYFKSYFSCLSKLILNYICKANKKVVNSDNYLIINFSKLKFWTFRNHFTKKLYSCKSLSKSLVEIFENLVKLNYALQVNLPDLRKYCCFYLCHESLKALKRKFIGTIRKPNCPIKIPPGSLSDKTYKFIVPTENFICCYYQWLLGKNRKYHRYHGYKFTVVYVLSTFNTVFRSISKILILLLSDFHPNQLSFESTLKHGLEPLMKGLSLPVAL